MSELYVIMCLHLNIVEKIVTLLSNKQVLILSPVKIKNDEIDTIKRKFSNVIVIREVDFHDFNKVTRLIEGYCERPYKILAVEEYCILMAAKCRSYFKIGGRQENQVLTFRDKLKMMKSLVESNVLLPDFLEYKSKQDLEKMLDIHSKIILKPRFGMGAKDTYIIEKNEQILEVLDNMRKDKGYIVEEFIEGEVYHCDAVIDAGEILFVNVMKYLDYQYNFSIDQYSRAISVIDKEKQKRLQEVTQKIIRYYDLNNVVIHLEIIERDEQFYFCEMALRAGGSPISECLDALFGLNLIECDILLQLNKKLGRPFPKQKYGGWVEVFPKNGVIKSITGIEKINRYEWVSYAEIKCKVGEHLFKPKHCSDTIASFAVVGINELDILTKIDILTHEFQVIYES